MLVKSLREALKGFKLLLVSKDFKFLYEASKVLKSNGIVDFREVENLSDVKPRCIVITTDHECDEIEYRSKICLGEVDELSLLVSIVENVLKESGKQVNYVVGIDPGKTYGIALLISGILIKGFVVKRFQELMNFLTDLDKRVIGCRTYKLRVGCSIGRKELNAIANITKGKAEVEVVDEKFSSIKKTLLKGLRNRIKEEDIVSACAIASCKGKVVNYRE